MRPANALIKSKTSSGIEFQFDAESIRGRSGPGGGTEQVLALLRWEDRDAFCRDVVGFTQWRLATTLERTLPLRHPTRSLYWCAEAELYDYGIYDQTTETVEVLPARNKFVRQDWCRYLLTFRIPPWRMADDALVQGINDERARYVTVTEMPRPREKRVSGFGYEYLPPGAGRWVTIPDEAQFIPDYQIDLVVEWRQIPIDAVPRAAIADCLNAVNDKPIDLNLSGRGWDKEVLLLKGFARPFEQYVGSDGGRYYDLAYLFTAQPGGWNSYLTRDIRGKQFSPIRIKAGPAAGLPPYATADFDKLFRPGF